MGQCYEGDGCLEALQKSALQPVETVERLDGSVATFCPPRTQDAKGREPICNFSFDESGNLRIFVPFSHVYKFGQWINDEYGNLEEQEMYELHDVCEAHSSGDT